MEVTGTSEARRPSTRLRTAGSHLAQHLVLLAGGVHVGLLQVLRRRAGIHGDDADDRNREDRILGAGNPAPARDAQRREHQEEDDGELPSLDREVGDLHGFTSTRGESLSRAPPAVITCVAPASPRTSTRSPYH